MTAVTAAIAADRCPVVPAPEVTMTFVRTVLGDIDAGDLGVTYAHEHLVIDGGRPVELEPDFVLADVDADGDRGRRGDGRSACAASSTRCRPTPAATPSSWPS